MNVLIAILKELLGALIADCLFTFVIVLWIVAASLLNPAVRDSFWPGPIFLVGLVGILLFSVAPIFRPSALPSKTVTTQP